jgi:hypothetical protein
MLLLDSTLQSRLDGLERQPAIEVLSSEFLATIPFQGNSFGISGSSTFQPQLLSLTSGRLGQFYIDSSAQLKWMYTDAERNQWTTYNLASITTHEVLWAHGVELANGNIGVVFLAQTVTNDWHLYDAVIAPTGAIVTAASLIEDLSNSYDWRAPYVTQLASGDFYLVYIREDPDTAWAIYARTCTTWGTWGAASDITPSGVDTATEIDNPSLFETEEGDLFLLFDHVTSTQDDVTIKNIFSSISTDDGASWSTAEARTNYTSFGSNGLDPVIVQKANGTAWLIFYENIRVLHMDESATGFLECGSYGMGVKDTHVDSVNRKIYVVYGNSQPGTKSVGGVAVVDIATWSIDKVYYPSSTPALNQLYCDDHVWNNFMIHGDGKYLAMAVNHSSGHIAVAVIDHTTDTITNYTMDDLGYDYYGPPANGIPTYGLPRSVEFNSNPRYGFLTINVACVRVDASRDRIYFGWDGGYWRQYMMFSYIDLTAAPDGEGMYSMTWVTNETSGISIPGDNRAWYEYNWAFEIDTERQYFVCYSSGGGNVGSLSWNGGCAILSEPANGAIVKYYVYPNNNGAPRWGPHKAIIHDGVLYGSMYYCSAWPHTDQRGLVKINYLTDAITYHQPSFVTADQYFFQDFALDEDNGRIYCASPWGIARFTIASGAWTLFSNDTLPGFTRPGESNSMGFVSYDPVEGNVIMGAWNDYTTNFLEGIGMFNENGAYNQLQYITADKAASWSWGSQLDLSYYSNEAYPSAVIDVLDALWVTWNHIDWEQGINVLYWGNDLGAINLTDDIMGTVSLNWQLKRINKLDFKLANGHLYDPQNLLSTKNIVGQKGRKMHVRIGEHIGGFTYWVNQGTYIVDTVKMDYKRGTQPALTINGTGKTSLWRHQQVAVSTLYSGQMPDDLLRDFIDDNTQLLDTEYDLPVFNSEHSLYYQWIDKTVWDIVEEICDHFFYAMYEDVDGVFTCRRVSLTQTVDHEYADDTHLQNFGPDDNYSDYTNRVRGIGESNDYTEVLHAEELITSRGGSVGWWTKKSDEDIYFSEDGERQCRNPRLNVIHSPKEYDLLLDQLARGEGGITLSYIDPYEKYVTVEIEVRDLTMAFAGAVLAMVGIAAAATWCGASLYSTCGGYIWATAIAAGLVFYILAAMASYQYEIWARPVGRVKNTIQYVADDLEFQSKLNGEIITEEITDPLCQSVTECRRVAEGNLEMIKAQRRRIRFNKLAHLQDELMDKIKVYHPYSGEGMELLVVGLKRTYTKGEGGGVFDEIDGWRYIP